jgi:signal transduction histidine kinase
MRRKGFIPLPSPTACVNRRICGRELRSWLPPTAVFAARTRTLLIISLLAIVATPSFPGATQLPRAVLIIDEADPNSGSPTAFSRTLRSTLNQVTPSVAVFGETFDFSHFYDLKADAILRPYVQQKYADVPFGAIVAVGASSFHLVERWRSELWPSVPVIFAAIDQATAAELNFDSNTTGLIMRRTINSMVTSARILVPDLQGVAVMGGLLERDPYRFQYLPELPRLANEIELTNLTGLPLAEQLKRAAALPDKTAILYTSLFIDDAGTRYSSPDVLAEIGRVANGPIVVDVESLVGFGATGGIVLRNVSYGKEVAALTLRILDGASVAENPIAVSESTQPIFDWRQLKRWGISEKSLPPGSEIRFREAGIWDLYRTQILAAIVVILAQTLLILWLIYEQRRRHLAEIQSRNAMADLTRMDRAARAGLLSASMAHEVNQPLVGISMQAVGALHWLRAEPPNLEKVGISLQRIADDSSRAADVITSIRALFKKGSAIRKRPISINRVIRNALAILRVDLEGRGVMLQTQLDERLPLVEGDEVQLQQLVINLIMNAAESMQASRLRLLTVKSGGSDSEVLYVSIEDTGTGIDPDKISQIFNPLFTSKPSGMGMGLSICHSIIENHGGQIWASRGVNGGSIFQFELPINSNDNQVTLAAE